MTDCRLLIDPPASGAWNMAVDEVLLEWAAESGQCGWRFYRWSEPTLSLGYFQDYEDRHAHQGSRQCAVVRRASGGGAILHDAELTYSFVVPRRHRLALERAALYEAIHATLIEVLEQLGVGAGLCGSRHRPPVETQPFLCFQRRSDGDVLVGEQKVAGSAQRRNYGAILQHGSILLGRSVAAPELPGINDLAVRNLDSGRLIERWLPRIAQRLELSWCEQALSEEERQRVQRLVASKYGAELWIRHRGRPASG